MRLAIGDPAKLFETTDINGNPVALEDYRGKLTLLSFFRSASCPLCSLRVHYLIDRYPMLHQRGLSVLPIFETSREMTIKFVGKQQPPFPLITNPSHDLYRLYGTETSLWGLISGFVYKRRRDYRTAARMKLGTISDGNLARLPADFLLGPDLVIAQAYYGRDIGDHLPFSEIDRFLASRSSVMSR
jgi:peroxiredoxin Q/BCP